MKKNLFRIQFFVYQNAKIITAVPMLLISNAVLAQNQTQVVTTVEKGISEIIGAVTGIILLVGIGFLGIGWMIKSFSDDERSKETGQKVMKGALALFAGAALVYGGVQLQQWLKTLAGSGTY